MPAGRRSKIADRSGPSLSVRPQSANPALSLDTPNRALTEDALDAVDDNDAERTLVRVAKDLVQVLDLLGLGEADHVLGADELDERELGRERDRRRERRLARPGRTVQQDGNERGALRRPDLLDEQLAVAQDALFTSWIGNPSAFRIRASSFRPLHSRAHARQSE